MTTTIKNDLKMYSIKKIINKNNYSEIYKAMNIKTDQIVAIKQINIQKYKKLFGKEINKINIEVHKNSIKIIDTFKTKDYFNIIMEYLINLEDYIDSKEKPLEIEEIKIILSQLNSYFKNNTNYMKLRLYKIFLSFKNLNEYIVKVSNLGLNDELLPDISIELNEFNFEAPEEFEGNKNDKSVIWSLGIIIYYMLFKEFPYNEKTDYKKVNQINNVKIKQPKNNKLRDLLSKMLEKSYEKRLSWNEYFEHSFFENDKKKISFSKMNSLGNDVAIFDLIDNEISFSHSDLIIKADRNFGIGCNKIITLHKSTINNVNKEEVNILAKIYNENGKEILTNLNGIRCIAGYIKRKTNKKLINIIINEETIKINLNETKDEYTIEINMGIPIVNDDIVYLGEKYKIILVNDFDNLKKNLDIKYNIIYVKLLSNKEIFIRIIEKNNNEILSSETGSCVAVAWCIDKGLTDNEVNVFSKGSDILNNYEKVYWEGENKHIFLTGSYEFVYNGEIEI